MKNIVLKIAIIAVFCLIDKSAVAQYTINNDTKVESRRITRDTVSVQPGAVDLTTINEAFIHNEKMRKRKEHNFIETKNSIQFTQFGYTNWAAGGENTFNGRVTSFLRHVYKDKKFNVQTKWDAAFGLGNKEGRLWVTEDRFQLNSSFSYQIRKRWFYNFNAEFRSQFANSYSSVDDEQPSSHFMAPATINLALGVLYKVDEKRTITISPVSGNMLFVRDAYLSEKGAFGVDPGKRFKPEIGAFVKVQWTEVLLRDKKKADKPAIITFRTEAQGFSNYKEIPTLNWQNWIDVAIFKYFSLNFSCDLIYNNKAVTPGKSFWQFSEVLGFGITYTFKNKKDEKALK